MALGNQEKAIILNSHNILNMLILLRVIEGTFRDQRHLKCSKYSGHKSCISQDARLYFARLVSQDFSCKTCKTKIH